MYTPIGVNCQQSPSKDLPSLYPATFSTLTGGVEEERVSEDPVEQLLWSHRIGGAYMPSPLLYGGRLYVVHHNGRIVAYDAISGKALLRSRFSKGGSFTGSPVASNGRLYVPTEGGLLSVLDASTDYQELAIHDSGQPLMASPSLSEGVLFIRTPKYLFALGVAE